MILGLLGVSLTSCSLFKGPSTVISSNPLIRTKAETSLQIISVEMLEQYGDSFIIKYGNWEMLVDAGSYGDKGQVQAALREYVTDGVLDMLMVSHLHSDHMGSLTSVSFFDDLGLKVSNIVDNGNTASSSTVKKYSEMRSTLISRGANYFTPWDIFETKTVSQKFMIDEKNGVFIEFFDAGKVPEPGVVLSSDQMNPSSIPAVFNYPNTKIAIAGDLPATQEGAWVNSMKKSKEEYFKEEDNNVFKSCHHGSSTSNGNTILKYVKPDMVFSMSGMVNKEPNGSQHPTFLAVDRELKYTDKIYWSGINGTTEFWTDGDKMTMEGKGRSKDYYVEDKLVSRTKEKNITLIQSAWYKELAAYMG